MDEGNRRGRRVGIAALAGPAAALILLAGAPAAAGANTLYVNAASGTDSATCGASTAPCQTIQQAVDIASDGDTVVVAAGTYPAAPPVYFDRLVIDKSVTLQGAQAGNAGSAARAAAPASESVIGEHVDVESSGVRIDGFSFDYPGTQLFVNGPTGTAIANDVFTGYEPDGYTAYGITAAIGINAAPDTQISRNYFTSPDANFDAVAQWFNGGCSGADVSGNVFADADASALADIYFYCDDEPLSTIAVSGNQDTIGGSSSFVNFQHIGGAGGEIDVTDNTITMTPASGSSGMYFANWESGVGKVEISGNSLTGDPFRAVKLSTNAELSGQVSITGNDFSHNGVGVYVGFNSLSAAASLRLENNDLSGETGDNVPDPGAGVYLAPGAEIPASIAAAGNDLSGSSAGVYVGGVDSHGNPSPSLAPSATVTLHGNNLAGDGVYNDPSSGGTVDALDNWWGCNAGPGQPGCAAVSGGVTFDPWLVLGISASPNTLQAGHASTVTADVTHDSAGNDASASGTLPDGTTIAFTTDFGLLSAPTAGTVGGKASVTLTSPAPGTANVSATLDSQTVSTPVTFKPNMPTSADQCKKGGWQTYGVFKNQGDCVSFVATGGRNRPAG